MQHKTYRKQHKVLINLCANLHSAFDIPIFGVFVHWQMKNQTKSATMTWYLNSLMCVLFKVISYITFQKSNICQRERFWLRNAILHLNQKLMLKSNYLLWCQFHFEICRMFRCHYAFLLLKYLEIPSQSDDDVQKHHKCL